MAFSIRKREEKNSESNMGLLDSVLMQNLQDRFCDANNLYLACLSRKQGVITKAYGSKEELTYIHSLVGMDLHVTLLNRLFENESDSVVEENCGMGLVKMCGVSIRVGGEITAIWIVIGVMERTKDQVPDFVMKTTPDRYYKSLEFLETLSRQMFAVKLDEILAHEAFLRSRESERQMEAELRRNETMTAVVKMLESESGFTEIVDEILRDVCEYLRVSNGALFRENINTDTVDMVCEYAAPDMERMSEKFKGCPRNRLPFFNGKPYMISANSMMPEGFHELFEKQGINAGVFLPIDGSGRQSMYLCFYEKAEDKIWDVNDIKFINDVKRIIQSILVKRIAKNSLESSYASLEAILENVGCGIYVKDPVTEHILYTNQKFRDSFRKTIENRMLEKYLPKRTKENSEALFREIYSEEEGRWFDFHEIQINWVDGRVAELCTIYDVTDNKNYQKKIEKQANNDFLTGLYNRRRCEHDMTQLIEEARETGESGALLYLDLDDFKHINDGLGHQYGDILLQNISKSLLSVPGVEDHCYRVGGDEFIIIVVHKNYGMLERIIHAIKALFAKPWMLKGGSYYCTMSMGVVQFTADGTTAEELIKKADLALYDAKCAGKNRVSFYAENVESNSVKRLDLEKSMRNAVKNGMEEFEVYFQPIMDVTREENPCVGAEALVRWNSKELGFISPVDFIPLAEYLGLIIQIGEHVLREACAHCKLWNDAGHPEYTVNVNFSVIQLLQPNIVELVRTVLEETGLIPEHLHLEVTESLAVSDMEQMKRILGDIKSLGVKVALDDFGTGYSSLNHIREMPIDIIKIDRCFIIDIGKDDFSKAFVKMVTELGNAIGVKICVEGVELYEQLKKLKEICVHMIQGYYFGKPMTVEAFEQKYL